MLPTSPYFVRCIPRRCNKVPVCSAHKRQCVWGTTGAFSELDTCRSPCFQEPLLILLHMGCGCLVKSNIRADRKDGKDRMGGMDRMDGVHGTRSLQRESRVGSGPHLYPAEDTVGPIILFASGYMHCGGPCSIIYVRIGGLICSPAALPTPPPWARGDTRTTHSLLLYAPANQLSFGIPTTTYVVGRKHMYW